MNSLPEYLADLELFRTTASVVNNKFGLLWPVHPGSEATAVDGRTFAPPEKPWNDGSPVNTNKHWLPMVSKWYAFHPQYQAPRAPKRPATGRNAGDRGGEEAAWRKASKALKVRMSRRVVWLLKGFAKRKA